LCEVRGYGHGSIQPPYRHNRRPCRGIDNFGCVSREVFDPVLLQPWPGESEKSDHAQFRLNLKNDGTFPSQIFVLKDAWVNPPEGQYGTGSEYSSDYQQQHRPLENGSIGRIFRIKEGINLSIRADFQNIFNRSFWNNRFSSNAQATQVVGPNGVTITGFGQINTCIGLGILGRSPRMGKIIFRLSF
jgi:hypothetical protein